MLSWYISFLLRTRFTKQNLATVEVLDVGEAEDYGVSVGKYILTRFWSADKNISTHWYKKVLFEWQREY